MDVFDIGERDLGTRFTFCSKAQELGFQQHVNPKACRLWLLREKKKKGSQRQGRFSTEKTYFPVFIYTNRFFVAFQVLPPAVFPMKVTFSNP